MDMCSAIKDPKLAKLYTSRNRCMFEFEQCVIYNSNKTLVSTKKLEELVTPSFESSIEVGCEYYSQGSCLVLRRILMPTEVARCSQFYSTCPLRLKAMSSNNVQR
ncbi:hypothetical protein B9P99_04490 [Candidatus Marsarchaeota G1 archaeon OSP_B]|jgi:hypothetical protein|nr:MAG: hypothetical protein B9Q01_02465 [Candidatus Marsarchaeota G1 archaeon OSP_D]PSN86455.1 MAG: hypothetical protein B9Q02_02330 [Candidatus Marsarchaeota G1 archaeon BE_D]PSN89288.1 MAG: hypothetical protein B9Q00_02025 [Candidatus Marsarchaeota G1 archaeon OSP_C]PSN90802.1 MAG: hypothetical protein B9P99_04490 [Candidatus Marsarchaeota G1 archaeon OSP_B]